MADATASRITVDGDEWVDRVNSAAAPTSDDQTLMLDGQVLDSPEAVLRYFAELEKKGETDTSTEWAEALARFEAGESLAAAGD
ncbi:MAG TPA: hypothetical protein VMW08_04120 [Acidimicrobiales bacterium]|nr:hypothetical protein [Acidimicrobiales bacterium]